MFVYIVVINEDIVRVQVIPCSVRQMTTGSKSVLVSPPPYNTNFFSFPLSFYPFNTSPHIENVSNKINTIGISL